MIYIGIPVHNERDTIGPLLWRIRELLYGEQREFHVMVCDDASDDGTAESLAQYPPTLPLTLIRNEHRVGYAASLERLIRATLERSTYPKRDALVTVQADFSDPPERIPDMIRHFEGGADLVTVARRTDEPRPRRLTRLGGKFLARGLRPPDVTDPYASLRLYRLFALGRALERSGREGAMLRYEGWAANAEVLLRVWPFLRRFEEVPAEPAEERRYRPSRFRPSGELRGLMRASRDPALRELGREDSEAA